MILRPVLMAVDCESVARGPERVAMQSAAARTALARCADLCGVGEQEWVKDAAGVPQPSQGYHWSISHKPTMVAAVIADRPVGIDVERVTERNPDLFRGLASDEEWALFGERSWEVFFRLWTAKEATLKAHGVGVAGLKRCRLARVVDELHLRTTFEGRERPIEHHWVGEHLGAVTVDSGDAVEWAVTDQPD